MLTTAILASGASAAASPHPVMILPFVVMLLSIAILPLLMPKFWGKYYNFVALGLGCVTLSYYLFYLKDTTSIIHVVHEYFSFIALIGSLFVVSGGIHIAMKGNASPIINVIFLAIGSILSNLVGTTGASMLMIRPWIRMNKGRIGSFHIVFFIFIISNISGALTPIGDPPLFLGFLRGLSFWWTLQHCWVAWAVALGIVLAVFFIFDCISYNKFKKQAGTVAPSEDKFKIQGLANAGFLLMILVAVFIEKPLLLREALMIVAAVGSYLTTPKRIHEANEFNFTPIKEVAWLFIGIFLTMVPALSYLGTNAGSFGIDTPFKFFFTTGALSGILDNAPTYLTFLATAMGLSGLDVNLPAQVVQFASEQGLMLMAISTGAVFFGAMTYIGNGPNFMVKSIADQSQIKMPGFFGYIVKYSLPILIPTFLIVAFIFFR